MPAFGEYSEVAICNMALAEIGRGAEIVSLDEKSEAARACRRRYPYARDAVLRSYDWNFATRRASLPASADKPAFGYTVMDDEQVARHAVSQGLAQFALLISADFSQRAVPGIEPGAARIMKKAAVTTRKRVGTATIRRRSKKRNIQQSILPV